ncbi:hypothetical protein FE257_012187 [Aspergillus nanangensis]|uniref:Cyclopropane-fatty-acyl-phospholipid synthase n=1 Tax=Aspergillus nanangensis TaxID=2582783 RepID=A0AAD4CGC2_ASPNN|nr:hypothetical protein FE257_012187 [Aspergillus nanangensis]
MSYDWILDGGYLPRPVIRLGIRRQLAERLATLAAPSLKAAYERKMAFIANLRELPIAIQTDVANEQHYEVGTAVIEQFLGPRMKYSGCLYPDRSTTLEQAEVAMLDLYTQRAEIGNGMKILDLGCGWGSVSLYLAERYPHSEITALSNSETQKLHIDSKAKEMGLRNLKTVTADIVDCQFEPNKYDRVISIECFEHMKNYESLLQKVSTGLKPGGKLFVHIFAHRDSPYHFENEDGWMSEHFFSGGTMPSADLLLYFQNHLKLHRQWWVSGQHYARTCEDWLAQMLKNKKALWGPLTQTYGEQNTSRWFYRWQIFFMACSELFAYDGGDTWGVCHYLFEKPMLG